MINVNKRMGPGSRIQDNGRLKRVERSHTYFIENNDFIDNSGCNGSNAVAAHLGNYYSANGDALRSYDDGLSGTTSLLVLGMLTKWFCSGEFS